MEDVGQKVADEVGGYNLKMDMKIIEWKGNKIKFNVSGIDLALANALRRIILSGIPVMAIEKVTFYDNTSMLSDEIIAHRLGLVPIVTDLTGPDTLGFSLIAEGPTVVYSGDLKIKELDAKVKDESAKFTGQEDIISYKKIPIVKLDERQRVELDAAARIGNCKEHAKWQGGLASYEIKDDSSFDFFVESYGQFDIPGLIDVAFGIFNSMITDLKKEVEDIG